MDGFPSVFEPNCCTESLSPLCLGALRLCAESRVSASSKGKGYSAPEQQKHLHEGSDLQDSN